MPALVLAGTSSAPLSVAAKWMISARAAPAANRTMVASAAAADFKRIGRSPSMCGGGDVAPLMAETNPERAKLNGAADLEVASGSKRPGERRDSACYTGLWSHFV